MARGVEGNDLRGAGNGGIRDDGCGIGSVWGDHTCWTTTPVTGLCPPQLLRFGPGQRSRPWDIPHVHHGIVSLKFSDVPPSSRLLLCLDGGAAIDGVSTEGHPGTLSGQAMKTG